MSSSFALSEGCSSDISMEVASLPSEDTSGVVTWPPPPPPPPDDKVSSDDAMVFIVLSSLESCRTKFLVAVFVVGVSKSVHRRLRVAFQWFLIALSVLPGRSLAIIDHLFPWMACAVMIASSSTSL